MSRPDLPKWLTKTPVAHRGLHDIARGVPENSRLAFRKAMEAGYAIETDVRITGDGQVVVFHDADLKRLCGRDGIVARMPLADLKQLTLLGTGETVPSFRDLLDLVQGQVPLVVEIKKDKEQPIGPLETSVARMLQHYPGPFVVQSFNPSQKGGSMEMLVRWPAIVTDRLISPCMMPLRRCRGLILRDGLSASSG